MSLPGTGATRSTAGAVTRAAALIAGLTVLARVAGFGRVLTLARTVGPTCLGDTYQAVNAVPNIVFEIVAGGALASLVVPLLAGAVDCGEEAEVSRTSSALLTWSVIVLVPVAVVIALAAHPLAALLLDGKTCGPAAVRVGTSMLRVFAPQIPLYGIGVVLTGILQAHRRFTGPAIAPLLSSLVVIGAYLTFAAITTGGVDIGSLSTRAGLVLSVGTTLGVLALTVSMLLPLAAAGVRVRPRMRFGHGVAPRVVRLAVAGVATLIAQQAAVAVALRLGNAAGVPAGRYATFTYAQTVYLLPWGVLAVPIATSVYPALAGRAETGDRDGFARAVAGSTRGVVGVALLGAAVLAAVASPLARIVVQGAPGVEDTSVLAAGIVGFAPGLIGYGVFALLSRALYARGSTAAAAGTALVGWAVVVGADLLLAGLLPAAQRVLALAVANSAGMTVLGGALLAVVARLAGPDSLRGVGRVVLGGVVAGVVAAFAGRAVAEVVGGPGVPGAIAATTVAGAVTTVVYLVIAWCAAGTDDRAALGRIRRRWVGNG